MNGLIRLSASLFDISGRTLVMHEDKDFRDWGISAGLVYDPDPASKRGPSFAVRRGLGGASEGGLDAMFAHQPLNERGGGNRDSWSAEAAWGFPVFSGRYTGSPNAALGLADHSRDYAVGWELTPEADNAADLSLGLTATRRESFGSESAHGAGVELVTRW